MLSFIRISLRDRGYQTTPHVSIFVLGYSEAAALLAAPGYLCINAIIAIHGQREYSVQAESIPHRLILNFDDVDCPDDSDPIKAAAHRLRLRESAQMGLVLTPPTRSDAQKIIDFAHTIRSMNGTLLCQCQGGVSRSAAAALLCMAAWSEPGQEQACSDYLRIIRPCAAPHAGLMAYGDSILHRAGNLIATLQSPSPKPT